MSTTTTSSPTSCVQWLIESRPPVLTAVERRQAAQDLMLNDPRWALLLVMMAIFLIATHLSRVREQKLLSVPVVRLT